MQRYDVIVVGAGTAGLAAALVLGRCRRETLVIGGGDARNAPALRSHGLLTRDGIAPEDLLELARRELGAYPQVQLRRGFAVGASGRDGRFEVRLADGSSAASRRLLIATGVSDQLPDVPGFARAWGRGIHHCPHCDGWELRDLRLAVHGPAAELLGRIAELRTWSHDLVAIAEGGHVPADARAKLEALGIPLHEASLARIEGDPERGRLTRVTLDDGTSLEVDALFTQPPQHQRSDLAAVLGCALEEVAAGAQMIATDPLSGETSVPGVYAARDAGKHGPIQSLANAVATATIAAASLDHALALEDLEADLADADAAGRALAGAGS